MANIFRLKIKIFVGVGVGEEMIRTKFFIWWHLTSVGSCYSALHVLCRAAQNQPVGFPPLLIETFNNHFIFWIKFDIGMKGIVGVSDCGGSTEAGRVRKAEKWWAQL